MRRKPLDTGSAMAMGVDHLLRQYKHLKTNPGKYGQWVPPSNTEQGGPIEVSLLVASADAPAKMKRVADYVCDGIADEIEIIAALDELGAFWGGVVQLTEGSYYCAGPIDFPTYGGALRGAGIQATYIETSAASPSSSLSFIQTGATWSFITDMNVGVVHDGYEYAINANTSTTPITPVIERVNVRNEGTGSAVYGAIHADIGVTLRNVEITYTNHSCDGIHAWSGRANIIDCLINFAGSSGNGSGIGIYLNDITQDSSKVRGCTIGTGVTGVGIDIACNKAIVTNNHVFNTGGIQVRSGITDVILDNNYGTITDLGTNTRIGLATGDTITDDDAIHDNVAGEISAITAKATPVSGDFLLIEDSEAANAKKKITIGDLPGGSGGLDLTTKGDLHSFTTVDAALTVGLDGEALFADSGEAIGLNWRDIVEADISDLDHTDTSAIHDDVASEISAITAKATPTSADFLLIEDAAAANVKKRITIGDLPGGTGLTSPLTTKGDLWGFDTDDARIPAGTDNYVLTADSAVALGVKWAAAGSGTDSDAIHDNVAGEIVAVTQKAVAYKFDTVLIEDSEASNVKKSMQLRDLGYATEIGYLNDVELTTPVAGDALIFGPGSVPHTISACTASSVTTTNYCTLAYDNNTGTGWIPSGRTGEWVYFDLGSIKTTNYIALGQHDSNRLLTRIRIDTSDDASTWDTGHVTPNISLGWNYIDLKDDPITARYIRLWILDDTTLYWRLTEVNFSNETPIWYNGVPDMELDDLTDVDLTTTAPTAGDMLTFDGSNWVPLVNIDTETWGTKTVTVGTGLSRLYAPVAMTIVDVRISVGTAPTGGPCTIDVNKNGTSIYPTASKPSIASGTNVSSLAVPDTTAVAADDYITIDIDAANSAEHLVVMLRWRKT